MEYPDNPPCAECIDRGFPVPLGWEPPEGERVRECPECGWRTLEA